MSDRRPRHKPEQKGRGTDWGCLGVVFMVCLTAIVIAAIVWGG